MTLSWNPPPPTKSDSNVNVFCHPRVGVALAAVESAPPRRSPLYPLHPPASTKPTSLGPPPPPQRHMKIWSWVMSLPLSMVRVSMWMKMGQRAICHSGICVA